MSASSKDRPKQNPSPNASASPKKRFRIEKLEERVTPKSHGGGGQLSSGAVTIMGPSIY